MCKNPANRVDQPPTTSLVLDGVDFTGNSNRIQPDHDELLVPHSREITLPITTEPYVLWYVTIVVVQLDREVEGT